MFSNLHLIPLAFSSLFFYDYLLSQFLRIEDENVTK